jgi:hypothetical protein
LPNLPNSRETKSYKLAKQLPSLPNLPNSRETTFFQKKLLQQLTLAGLAQFGKNTQFLSHCLTYVWQVWLVW